MTDDLKQGAFAALLLVDDASTWLQSKFTTQQLAYLGWGRLRAEILAAFKPVDATRRARDALASCVQTGSVQGYIAAFRRCLVQCTDVAAAEALDRFVRGLKPHIRKDVLVQAPATFDDAAVVADRISVSGKLPAPSHGGQKSSGSGYAPMELGAMQGQDRRGGRSGGSGSGGGGRKCYLCGQVGHFKRECPKRGRAQAADGGSKNPSAGHH